LFDGDGRLLQIDILSEKQLEEQVMRCVRQGSVERKYHKKGYCLGQSKSSGNSIGTTGCCHMPTALEIVVAKFKGPLTSKNKAMIKQINKYEEARTRIVMAENQASVLATWSGKSGLKETAVLLGTQVDLLKRERERYEKNISDLIGKLEADSK
jgi:hypothetical protein